MTIQTLQAYGANTAEGLARCMNNESFYLRLVGMALADGNFEKLRRAAEARDAAGVFEAVHALKGAVGNVSLTPIYEPVCALTEKLRSHTDAPFADDEGLVDTILARLEEACGLAE